MEYKFIKDENILYERFATETLDDACKLSQELIEKETPHKIWFDKDCLLVCEPIKDKPSKWGVRVFTPDNDEGLHEHYDMVVDRENIGYV